MVSQIVQSVIADNSSRKVTPGSETAAPQQKKTKKKAEKVLDEIAEQIGCCKADEIIYAGRGIGGLRVTVYQALAQEYV